MNEHFEMDPRLARTIRAIDIAKGIINEQDLVRAAVHLLEGDCAALLERKADGITCRVLEPPGSWTTDDVRRATQWYARLGEEIRTPGYTSDEPLHQIAGSSYAEAVVGIGGRFELLVLRKEPRSSGYTTHDCHALRTLIYEAPLIRMALASICNAYRESFGPIVRPGIRWSQIIDEHQMLFDDSQLRNDNYLWSIACEFLGVNRSELTNLEPDTPTLQDDILVVKSSERRLARAPSEFFVAAFHCLKCDEILEPPTLQVVFDISSVGTVGSVIWERVAIRVLEHGFLRILKTVTGASPPDKAPDSQTRSRGVSETTKAGSSSTDLASSARALLHGAAVVFGRFVEARPDREDWLAVPRKPSTGEPARSDMVRTPAETPREPSSGRPSPSNALAGQSRPGSVSLFVNRNVLWLYFACLLARSEKLAKRYLPDGGAASDGEVVASRELQHEYLRQLSRFMLGLLERLSRLLTLDASVPTVSRAEELDGLLYLVDRYGHVQLGVEEQLNIRYHIGRALLKEVEQHLGGERYRDHLLHAIDVFLLGHLLLDTRLCWVHRDKPRRLVDELVAFASENAESWMRNWAVAALLHDVGYQMGAAEGQATPRAWREYFKLDEIGLGPELGPTGQPVLDDQPAEAAKYQELIDRLLQETTTGKNGVGNGSAILPMGASAHLRDHGILSALRVAQILLAVDAQDGGNTAQGGVGSRSLLSSYRYALHAISHHNTFTQRVRLDTHPLSCLLRLCDELQEWGRHRVNIEQMVKQLYLAIEGESSAQVVGRDLLTGMRLNDMTWTVKDEVVEIELVTGKLPHFSFILEYRPPDDAQYEPTLLLLSKAFNLQHLHLACPEQTDRSMRWYVELCFPRPAEYEKLSEYDLYAAFAAGEVRGLPLLELASNATTQGQGLLLLDPREHVREDRFAIVVAGAAERMVRPGWLPLDPDTIVRRFLDFKKSFLSARYSARTRAALGRG